MSSPVPSRARPAPLMAGKRGLVMGVANDRSLAWGIAAALAGHGAELAFTYQGETLERRVRPLAASVGADIVMPADATDPASLDAVFACLGERWGKLDFLVHAIAWADREALRGRYIELSREQFLQALEVSCYSFTDLCRRAEPMANPGASFLTLTYYGAEKAIPRYNVMGVAKAALEASVRYLALDLGDSGIRVNAISAGPIRTLAAAGGLSEFHYILKWNALNSPMRRNTTIQDVGGAGVYLLSSLAAGVTGEIHHVDCGYHVIGMKHPLAPDISAAGS